MIQITTNINASNRIVSMDVMRGLSILGIFLVNMLAFHSPILYLDPFATWTNSIDKGIYMFIDVFIQGSFYPLFSLLFGYGFMILRDRTLERGQRFAPLAWRRLLFLLLVGWLHAHYIWHGDILFTYAVFGMIFLPFMRLSAKTQLILGGLLYLLPNLLLAMLMLVVNVLMGSGDLEIFDQSVVSKSYEVYQTGTWAEINQQRAVDWYLVNNPANTFFMLFSIFPMFLVGGAAAKKNWLRQVGTHRKKFLLFLVFFSVAGVLLKSTPYIMEDNLTGEYVQDLLGGPLLAISYALSVALLVEKTLSRKFMMIFAPVGKLSLTNYLIQSLLSTVIFYSYGLGFYGEISVWQGTILAVTIYTLQVIFSHWWVKKFSYGPFEWVWRCITYNKIMKL